MKYDFDTLISRNDTGSLKWDKYGDRDVIPVWVADMDFPLAPEIQQALTDRLQHPVFGYTRASARLYDVLIQHISSVYGWSIEKEWINWIPGVVSGLAASTRAYASPGSEIIVNPPIYHHFFQVHDESRNKLVKVPLCVREGRWTYDLEAMKQSIGPDTSLILLCSPHNPTGTVFTQQELDSVCELAAEVDAVVVSDEIHCGLVLDSNTPHVPTVLASPQNQDRIVTLLSLIHI